MQVSEQLRREYQDGVGTIRGVALAQRWGGRTVACEDDDSGRSGCGDRGREMGTRQTIRLLRLGKAKAYAKPPAAGEFALALGCGDEAAVRYLLLTWCFVS